MVQRVHILGASGSGTTTLGAALAERFGYLHLDTDDYFWERTDPPFQRRRERSARTALLGAAFDAHPRWVLTGSLCGWGDIFISRFELVVFIVAATEIRLARLRERERQRYGNAAIAPGGAMYAASVEFLRWAAEYDDGCLDMRSRALHEKWLATLPCPVTRLECDRPVTEQVARVANLITRDDG